MDGGNAGAEVPCACWQHRYRDNQRRSNSYTDSCPSVGGSNSDTHSQHMGRACHIRLGSGCARSGDARGDGRSTEADHGQQTIR